MKTNTIDYLNFLEALLYSQGGELEINKILKALDINKEELNSILEDYNASKRGLSIVADAKMIALRVSPGQATFVNDYLNSKEKEVLTKASLEVLAIILYSNDVTAKQIDYIRGVNSAYTLRQLTVRGLVLKKIKGMSHVYKPSVELLSILGIANLSALPHRDDILKKLENFKKQNDKVNAKQDDGNNNL